MAENLKNDGLHRSREFFDSLSEREKALALTMLDEMSGSSEGRSDLVSFLWELDYWEKPVDIRTFMTDDQYLGAAMKETLYPKWLEELEFVFRPGSPVREWCFGGAIGTGKSTCACSGLQYLNYRVACLRNPQRYYHLVPTEKIVFGIYSVTKRQVQDVGYAKYRGYLEANPWFKQKFPWIQRITTKIAFQRSNLLVMTGSREFHSLGLDTFAFLMDEVNFMSTTGAKDGDPIDQAQSIYDSIKSRVVSRFMQMGGEQPGMLFLISSKRTTRSFMEEHLRNSRADVAAGRIHVSDFAMWDVKDKKLFTKPKFRVEVGDKVYPSRILDAGDSPRPSADIIEVPGELRQNFDADLDRALRDHAGVATHGLSPLFRDKSLLYRCVSDELQHPFTKDVVPLSTANDVTLDEYFLPERLLLIRNSVYKPRLNPDAPRFVHLDLALRGDSAGLAMGHIAAFHKVRRQRGDGTFYDDMAPIALIELMLRVEPPKRGTGAEVDLSKLRGFIINLRDLGYPIRVVSADGYQSADTIQILRKIGFDAVLLSIDRTDVPYMHLRQGVFEQRVWYYRYEPFLTEVGQLERDIDRAKVDHPAKGENGELGRKDVSDAVAGVVTHCVNAKYEDAARYAPEVLSSDEPLRRVMAGAGTTAEPALVKIGSYEVNWREIVTPKRRT